MTPQSGFTLLELIVTLAIVSVLSTIAVPLVSHSLKRWKVDRFARVALTLHWAARMKAVGEQVPVQVRYDLDGEMIRVLVPDCDRLDANDSCDESTDWSDSPRLTPLRADADAVDLRSVGTLRTGEACIVFHPDGTVLDPRDRSGRSGEDCTGEQVGGGVHVTWKHPSPDPSRPCRFRTLYTIAQGSATTVLLEYGAYPSSRKQHREAPFRHYTLGSPPACYKS